MTWDYLVIGAGSSGCVVANRLSESPRTRVLVLEAGSGDGSMAIKVPGIMSLADMKRLDWGYRTTPDPTRYGKSEQWPRGRVLGGTSSINGMNYVWGAAVDYDRWAAMGNAGWAAKDVLPLFGQLERCDRRSLAQRSEHRGQTGAVHVRKVVRCHPTTRAFIEAAQSLGHLFNPDYNGATQEGVGYAQLNQRRGRRWSAADAFLKPAMHRDNLKVLLNAHVHKLLIEQRRVKGIVYEQGGSLHEVRAHRVVLCGGAINTPQLLLLSGIGDPEELSRHGIAVVLQRQAVGKNLLEHPLLRVVCRVSVPTYNPPHGWLQKIGFLAQYLLSAEGPLASINESIAFLKTRPEELYPDVQLHFVPLGYTNDGSSAFPQVFPYPSVTVVLNKNHPVSRGRVRLASADPRTPPLIEPRLLADESDLHTLVRGIGVVRRILAAPPIARWITAETMPGAQYATAEALEAYVRRHTEPTFHPVGTCRMGNDEEAVVTPQLKVRGMENLWIADASIMPDMISGNTNAACMMIGEKLGRQLAQSEPTRDLQREPSGASVTPATHPANACEPRPAKADVK